MTGRHIGWFFMLDEDLASFGEQLHERLPSVGWRTTHGGVVDQPDVLAATATSPQIAITASVAPPVWLTAPSLFDGITLRAGSLRFEVHRDALGPDELRAFDDLLAAVRAAYLSVARPGVFRGDGTLDRRLRIGPGARAWFEANERACLLDQSTYATYGLAGISNRPDLRPGV